MARRIITPARLVALGIVRAPPGEREAILVEMLAHIGAGLAVIRSSDAAAAEALYQAADDLVTRGRL
jgi:hypothetical protein